MTLFTLLLRTIRYYRKEHLLLLSGLIVSTAVLTSALIIGDSIQYSLQKIVDQRLGTTRHSIVTQERFFPASYATILARQLQAETAPLLVLRGSVSGVESGQRIAAVEISGVTTSFWKLGNTTPLQLQPNDVIINTKTAQQLQVSVGDELLVRVEKARFVTDNSPFVPDDENSTTLRLTVKAIHDAENFGNFNLRTDQITPYNLFVDLETLSSLVLNSANTSTTSGLNDTNSSTTSGLNDINSSTTSGLNDTNSSSTSGLNRTYANLLLIGENNFTTEQINQQVQKSWNLDVMNLELEYLEEQHQWELRSASVFMEDTLLQVLRHAGLKPKPVMSYLINFIHANETSTPYSFVSGLKEFPRTTVGTDEPSENQNINQLNTNKTPGIRQSNQLNDNEIIVNQWLADDLQLQLSDTLELEYFIAGPFRKLTTQKSKFIVRDIVAVKGFAADPTLMPAFEGLAGVETCSSWNAGIPMEFSKIRDKDEAWWARHKGTPKAFISYDKAVEIWGKEFGNSTSIRFDAGTNPDSIRRAILTRLQPGNTGMNIVDVRNDSRWSASNAVDFAGLFLALSFFLILAAFMLTGLLFSMMITQRAHEQGSYRALGIPTTTIRRLLFMEGMMNALAASIAGVLAGIGASYLLLYFLNSIWFDIVRTSSIAVFLTPGSLISGAISNLIVAAAVIALVLHHQFKKEISRLQQVTTMLDQRFSDITRKRLALTAGLTGFSFLIILIYSLLNDLHQNSTLLFISGFLLLVALICLSALLIHRTGSRIVATTAFSLAIRHLYFDWKRNITLISIVSTGIFIVLATGAYRVDFSRNAHINSSGTGGYDWFINTQLGLKSDLNTPEGRSKAALDELPEDARLVQMHRFESDDASCLNLNRVLRPSILGLDPEAFIERRSFSFVKTIKNNYENPWQLLHSKLGTNRIPAIADQTVITWGLGKSVGDSIAYLNEQGDTIQLILVAGLANSIFQGHLIIAEENFIIHFPGISGSKVMLVDTSINIAEETKNSSREQEKQSNSAVLNQENKFSDQQEVLSNTTELRKQNKHSEQQEAIKALLEGALRNYGVELQPAAERLAMFNSVTNTYLDIFLALGGIALLIGTIGIAILLVRSVHARRRIFAMMQAVGIPLRQLHSIITIEYLLILGTGITIGTVASAVASLSGLMATGAGVPYHLLLSIVLLFLFSGSFWIYIAARTTVRKEFIRELRNE